MCILALSALLQFISIINTTFSVSKHDVKCYVIVSASFYMPYVIYVCLKKRKCSTSFYVTHCDCYTLLSLTPFCWKKKLSYHVARILNAFKSHDFRKGIKGIRRMKQRKKGKILLKGKHKEFKSVCKKRIEKK